MKLKFRHEEEEVVGKLEKELGVWDPLEEVNVLKKMTARKKIGQARLVLGITPKYPVVIVPGMASTSLQVLGRKKKKEERKKKKRKKKKEKRRKKKEERKKEKQ